MVICYRSDEKTNASGKKTTLMMLVSTSEMPPGVLWAVRATAVSLLRKRDPAREDSTCAHLALPEKTRWEVGTPHGCPQRRQPNTGWPQPCAWPCGPSESLNRTNSQDVDLSINTSAPARRAALWSLEREGVARASFGGTETIWP